MLASVKPLGSDYQNKLETALAGASASAFENVSGLVLANVLAHILANASANANRVVVELQGLSPAEDAPQIVLYR